MTGTLDNKQFQMEALLRAVGEAVTGFNEILQSLDLPHQIDEIAYQFGDRHTLDLFTREAVMVDGCLMFNAADDHVHTLPLGTCYDVEYRFFSVPLSFLPGIEQVRIEAMRMVRGFSPLHQAEAISTGWGPVHASFKCQNEEEYGAVTHRLRDRGWEVAQKCDSTYGKFSYWKPLDRDAWGEMPDLYLKPRINLRDTGAHGD